MSSRKVKGDSIVDKNGIKYSVKFTASKGKFNGKTKDEILS